MIKGVGKQGQQTPAVAARKAGQEERKEKKPEKRNKKPL